VRTAVLPRGNHGKAAPRISAGSDRFEQIPVGLAGVEERPGPVVPKAGEAEGHSLDPLDQIVHRLGRAVGEVTGVPGRDLQSPALERATQRTDLRWSDLV